MTPANVRFGSKADITVEPDHVERALIGLWRDRGVLGEAALH